MGRKPVFWFDEKGRLCFCRSCVSKSSRRRGVVGRTRSSIVYHAKLSLTYSFPFPSSPPPNNTTCQNCGKKKKTLGTVLLRRGITSSIVVN